MYSGQTGAMRETNPVIQKLTKLTTRLLTAIYILSVTMILLMGGMILVVSAAERNQAADTLAQEGLATERPLPESWAASRMVIAGAGVLCLLVAQWGRAFLLKRERMWMGTSSLVDLGRLIQEKRAGRASFLRWPGPRARTGSAHPFLRGLRLAAGEEDPDTDSNPNPDTDSDPDKRAAVWGAQHLISRIAAAHAFGIVIAQLLAVMGLLDLMLTGQHAIMAGLLLAAGYLLLHNRPSRASIEAMLTPDPSGALERSA